MSSKQTNAKRSSKGRKIPRVAEDTNNDIGSEMPAGFEMFLECLAFACETGDLLAAIRHIFGKGAAGLKAYGRIEAWVAKNTPAAKIYDAMDKRLIPIGFVNDPFLSISGSDSRHTVEGWMRENGIEMDDDLIRMIGQAFNEQRRIFQLILAATLWKSDLRPLIRNDRNAAYSKKADQLLETMCKEYIGKYADPTMAVSLNFKIYARERVILASKLDSEKEAKRTGNIGVKELLNIVYGELDELNEDGDRDDQNEVDEEDENFVPAYRRPSKDNAQQEIEDVSSSEAVEEEAPLRRPPRSHATRSAEVFNNDRDGSEPEEEAAEEEEESAKTTPATSTPGSKTRSQKKGTSEVSIKLVYTSDNEEAPKTKPVSSTESAPSAKPASSVESVSPSKPASTKHAPSAKSTPAPSAKPASSTESVSQSTPSTKSTPAPKTKPASSTESMPPSKHALSTESDASAKPASSTESVPPTKTKPRPTFLDMLARQAKKTSPNPAPNASTKSTPSTKAKSTSASKQTLMTVGEDNSKASSHQAPAVDKIIRLVPAPQPAPTLDEPGHNVNAGKSSKSASQTPSKGSLKGNKATKVVESDDTPEIALCKDQSDKSKRGTKRKSSESVESQGDGDGDGIDYEPPTKKFKQLQQYTKKTSGKSKNKNKDKDKNKDVFEFAED